LIKPRHSTLRAAIALQLFHVGYTDAEIVTQDGTVIGEYTDTDGNTHGFFRAPK
jgi:hypothetical protein